MTSANGLISAERLAEVLDLPLQSVWRAARLGRIPGYRLGQLWRFDPVEVLAAMRSEAGPPAVLRSEKEKR
jgi:hypothetical protein